MNQCSYDETTGKTIAATFVIENKFLIAFTDKTCCFLVGVECDHEVTMTDGTWSLYEFRIHADDLLRLGVIDESDMVRMRRYEECEANRLYEQRRWQYERLKPEFEAEDKESE